MKIPLRPNTLSVLIQAGLVSLFAASTAAATTYTVTTTLDSPLGSGNSGSLRYLVGKAVDGDIIHFSCADLACPVALPIHILGNNGGFPGPTAYSIKGKSITIAAPNPGDVTLQAQPAGTTSGTSLRLFFIDTDAGLTLRNVTLTGGRAIGGNGGPAYKGSGGGAAGLGGAIFSQGSLSLEGVSFVDNGTVGGTSLGNPTFGRNYGGGGGLGGDGGGGLAGGGGGTGGDGGIVFDSNDYPGRARFAGVGGAGLNGTGGGTPGGYNLTTPTSYPIGPASNGGGGAGGYLWNGGNGSEGGGGGSSGAGSFNLNGGGSGGFGGGGGGSDGFSTFYMACRTTAGNGGFGGGGGSGCLAVIGAGGHTGGRGGVGGGGGITYSNQGTRAGGGAAFGGAVFARSGSVTVRSAGTGQGIAGNTLTAGSGAKNGAAAGHGLFLMSGVPTTFDITGTYTIADDIADDSVSSVPAGQSYTPGDGAGVAVSKSGAGTLILDGDNTYAGTTTVLAGTLSGVGSLAGPVSLGSGATIAPGDRTSVGLFRTGAFTWDGGGTVNVRLGATSARSDLLRVNGALAKGTAGTHKFRFGIGSNPPTAGTAYTVIQANDASAFAPGDFSFDKEPAYQNLTGTFSIVGNAVVFTVTGVGTDRIFTDGFQ